MVTTPARTVAMRKQTCPGPVNEAVAGGAPFGRTAHTRCSPGTRREAQLERLFMSTLLRILVAATLLLAGALASVPAHADSKPIYTGLFSDKAVSGYDVVAYFTIGQPTKGDQQFSHTHQGATWLFSSAANRDAFIADPAKYSPQFGGYCAWAVSQNKVASGDPLFWKIVDGKLYLNYDKNIQTRWEGDIPNFIRLADANWPGALAN